MIFDVSLCTTQEVTDDIGAAQTHLHQRRTGGKINLYVAAKQSGPARRARQVDRFDLQSMLLE